MATTERSRVLPVRHVPFQQTAAFLLIVCLCMGIASAAVQAANAPSDIGGGIPAAVAPTYVPAPPVPLPPVDAGREVVVAQFLSTTAAPRFPANGTAVDMQPALLGALSFPGSVAPLPSGMPAEQAVYPIDLPTVLQLAGANNLQIALAAERVNQATARAMGARALWIPSLNAGAVYNNHAGRLQATEGGVLEVSRNSVFVGGGAVTGTSATAGGASGPARMVVDLSLADAIFEPLAARQLVRATAADRTAIFNDTLLEVSAVYLALARAQAQVAIAGEAVRNADELSKITSDFADSGQGLQADADRAKVEAASRRRDVLRAREDSAVVSADLARLLRLDPAVELQAVDQEPAPLEFVDTATPLRSLIDQALSARPEVRSADAQRDAACFRQRQEQFRPWLPHLYTGFSSGGFGGGEGSDVENFAGRTDFDVAAVWELRNLGFGNVARQREQRSVYRQANLAMQQVLDRIASEVAQAYQRIQLRQRQIQVTSPQVEFAQRALELNLAGIRGGELRPIEIQQAIGALASSRTQHLDAVTDYNIAQLQMLRAIGQPPDRALSEASGPSNLE